MRRRLGAARRWLLARPAGTERQRRQLLASSSLAPAERALLDRAASRISHDDGMYKGDGEHYFKVGLSAIVCVDEALKAAGMEEVRPVLDMPCGYGRVLRFLVRRFPAAEFTACEIDPAAARFCAEQFGARPAQSSEDLDALTLDSKFDLVWCGSLVTHLDAGRIRALLSFFRRHLAPGGLVLFTTHGDYVANCVADRADFYALTPATIPSTVEAYRRDGDGYLDYPGAQGYGVSLTSPAWVREQVRQAGALAEVYSRARGWDAHQDVYGFVRRG